MTTLHYLPPGDTLLFIHWSGQWPGWHIYDDNIVFRPQLTTLSSR